MPARRLSAPDTVRLAEEAERAGWAGVWLSEVLGLDALVTLGAIANSTSRVRLGTAIVPITTRSLTVLAMASSTLAQLVPGRFHLGIGVSTPEIVDWRHDRPVVDPPGEAAAACGLLRRLLAGQTVDHGGLPRLQGTRIAAPEVPPPILLAALGRRMTEVAHQHADGVVLNLVPEETISRRAEAPPGFEVQLLLRVAVEPDAGDLTSLRRELAGYLRVPVYSQALEGFFDLEPVTNAPDVATAADRLPEDVVDQLAVVGSAAGCRARLERLVSRGVTPLVLPVGNLAGCLEALGGEAART